MPGLSNATFTGAVTLVNVWASWCVPCADEVPFLEQLSKDKRIQLVGINYKDAPDNARRFLNRYGNPFVASGADGNGRTSIDWGVYGVPETSWSDATAASPTSWSGRSPPTISPKCWSRKSRRRQASALTFLSALYFTSSGYCSAPNTNVSGTTPNNLKLTQKSVVCVRQTISLTTASAKKTAPSARSACASLPR